MKTAILCWSLFSITFALPIPQSPHANPVKKTEIEQDGSHSADMNLNTKAQKDAEIVPHHSIEAQKAAASKLARSHSAEISHHIKAQKNSRLSDARDNHYQDEEDPLFPFSNDENNGQEISRSSAVSALTFEPEHDQPFEYEFAADDPEDYIALADDPDNEQFRAELADDNFENVLESLDPDSDVPTEEVN